MGRSMEIGAAVTTVATAAFPATALPGPYSSGNGKIAFLKIPFTSRGSEEKGEL